MYRSCCIPNCGSRRDSTGVKLHRFPTRETGLTKWLESIKCPRLKSLSSQEMLKLYVCDKHFERKFVSAKWRVKISGYPTLFTEEEIRTGLPILGDSETQPMCDVTYDSNDHDYIRPGKIKHNDHTYSKLQPLHKINHIHYNDIDIPPSTSEVEHYETSEHNLILPDKDVTDCTVPSTSTLKSNPSMNEDVLQKIMTEFQMITMRSPKRIRFCVKKKTLLKKIKKASNERAKKIKTLSRKRLFDKIAHHLHPLTKKLLWMQLTQCKKKDKGQRFSIDEKIIALSIMKQSPKTYRLLRKIFILPSFRTLKKMISLLIDSGICSN